MSYRRVLRELAFDTHGVITAREAAKAGIPGSALRQLARRGALERRGQGVYRMTEVPVGPLDEFAEAVALVGHGAVLADESVLAAHDVAYVNLRTIKVAVAMPSRVRRWLPPTVEVVQRRLSASDLEAIDGVPAMSLAAAMVASRGRLMTERLLDALEQAKGRGLMSRADAQRVLDALNATSKPGGVR